MIGREDLSGKGAGNTAGPARVTPSARRRVGERRWLSSIWYGRAWASRRRIHKVIRVGLSTRGLAAGSVAVEFGGACAAQGFCPLGLAGG